LELTEAYPLHVKRSNIIYVETGARERGVSLKRYVTIGDSREAGNKRPTHARGKHRTLRKRATRAQATAAQELPAKTERATL